MSAYITIYCRSRAKTGPYMELMTWSRGSEIFKTLTNFSSYGKTLPFTAQDAIDALQTIKDEIEVAEEQRRREQVYLDLVKSSNCVTLDDLRATYECYLEAIDEIEDTLNKLHEDRIALKFFYEILMQDSVDLYIGYEDDPNFQENEKESN